ncbi:MAG: polyamine aminopropyltransferase [Bradymonadia bacterium]
MSDGARAEASSEAGGADLGSAPALGRRRASVFVASIFVAGLCSLVYELLIGTTSAYFLGDSIKQFSITIGLYMAAMGMGSFVSRLINGSVMAWFVGVELALGIIGGLSVPLLYLVYAYTDLYGVFVTILISLVGLLTGLEIPLIARALKDHFTLEVNLSNVLSLDYFGALAATLLFPFVLLPELGTFRSALAVGLLNLLVAFLVVQAFPERMSRKARSGFQMALALSCVGLIGGLIFAEHLLKPWHDALYEDRVALVKQTPYQKIVVTRNKHDTRLFLNGHLQFAATDEYRYHEALVHPVMSAAGTPANVLMLGGGDGLAVREVLKHPGVESVVLVDLDPAITELARAHPLFTQLNLKSLDDPRVEVRNEDAFAFLDQTDRRFDAIIADLPDPNNASLARLYSREFYRLLSGRLSAKGVLVTQATSPYFAKEAFWCVVETMGAAGLTVRPYHVQVPSFGGDWGFVLAGQGLDAPRQLEPTRLAVSVPTRFLETEMIPHLFYFPPDIRADHIQHSTLDRPQVLSYYLNGWKRWN